MEILNATSYVYRHVRLDINQPFYIGIGNDLYKNRANSVKYRNDHWKNIIGKTPYKVEILQENLTWDEARAKEVEFIALYGRSDLKRGPLCNKTDGGDGSIGVIQSQDTRLKRSLSMSGSNNPNYNKPLPDWHKEINRKTHLGKKQSIKTIEKRCLKLRKPVQNTLTNQMFESIGEASKNYNVSGSTITRWIKSGKNLKFL